MLKRISNMMEDEGIRLQMEAELKKNDAEAYAKFLEAYKEKNGFFNACKIYSDWKKNSKKK